MKSKIRKVTWLVWALLMLSGAGAWAAKFGADEGGVSWSYDTETHCLTISPRGTSGTVNKVTYPNGVTPNYACKYTSYSYRGTPAWLNTRYSYKDGRNNKNIDLKNEIQCVIVEEGVTKLGAATFRGLSNLKSVQLPSTLTTISVEVFRETGIETLRIPENVCEIGDRWITDAYDLNMISVDPNNKCFVIDAIYGALFTADMETLVRFPIGRCVKEVRIPEGVRKMATDAMYQLDCVEEIILPSTLDTVQYAVFDWCNNLKTIRFSSENPPVFASNYNLNPGDSWNYNQMTRDGRANRDNLIIYIPCTPDSTYNERTGKYEKVTKIDADKRIKGWLADFVIVATPVEESADGTPVSTEKGIAWVETKRTCDNDTTKIVAEAAEGARFIQWKQKSNGFITKENPYTFALGVSDTFYAYFAKGQYGVTALVNDTSLGVTSGSGVYTIGSNVTITAKTKNSCAKFEKWDDGVTTATRTITVGSKDTTVTALFSRYTYTVSASSNNYGVASIVDLYGKTISNGTSVGCGDTVVFVATPNDNSSFVEWSDGNKNEKDTIVVNSNISMTATFVQDSFLVRFLNEDGTKVLCEDKYVFGEIPSCNNTAKTATVEYSYTFNGWTPTVVAVSEAVDYKATYTQTAKKYTFKAIADNKTIKDTTIAFGENVDTPTAPDKKGYTFKYWMAEDSTQVVFPFNMAAHDTTVLANYVIDTFTLNYYNYDSTVVLASKRYVYDADVTLLNQYSDEVKEKLPREGYTFTGWDPASITKMPDSDVNVYARYNINKHSLIVKDSKGGELSKTTYEYGTEITEPSDNYSETGYTCDGWVNEAEDKVVFPFSMPDNDVVLTANCDINQYHLVFKTDENTSDIHYQFDENYGSPIDTTNVQKPEKEGYTFDGWNKPIPTMMPAYNDTLIAKWTINQYKYIVIKNNGENKDTTVYDYNAQITLPSTPVREGYTFAGWSDSTSVMPAKNLEVNGLWTINQYHLVFKTDENTSDIHYQFDVDYGFPIDTTNVQKPEKEGYTFAGWNKPIPTMMPAYDDTLIAKWTINQYKYIVIKNNGENKDTTVYDYNAQITLPSTPVREGYTFAGWSDSTSVMPAKNLVVEGQWTINQYKYVVVKNNGEDNDTTVYDYNAQITLPSTPVREGYTFAGWSDSTSVMPAKDLKVNGLWTINQYSIFVNKGHNLGSDTFTYNFNDRITPLVDLANIEGYTFVGWDVTLPAYMPANNIEVNAIWSTNTHELTFKYGQDSIISKKTVEYGSRVLAPKNPEKEGYTFVGWDSNVVSIMPDNDLTYTAVWTINQYPVTFYNEDGEIVWTDTLDYKSSFKEGYEQNVKGKEATGLSGSNRFIEWSPSLGDTLVPAGGVEFYPVFDGANYYFKFYDVDSTKVLREIRVTSAAKVNTFVPTERHEGCQFNHWNRFDGSEVNTWPIQIASDNDSVIAVFDTLSYDIQFNYGDGSDSILKLETIKFNRSVVYPADPTREGYTFAGWSDTIDVMPAENTVINAKWTINTHSVIYVSVIGAKKERFDAATYKYGDKVNPVTPGSVVGYTFNSGNWFDKDVNGQKIDFTNFTMPDKDTTIYAVYTVNDYVLTFLDYNDTVLCKNDVSYKTTLKFENYCSNPSREGYVFAGWSEALPNEMPANNVTLKAKYVIDTFQIIVKGCNDTIIDVVYNTQIDSLPYKTLEGRYFLGWRDAEIDGDSIEFPFRMPAHDTTIYCDGSGYANYEYVLTFLDYNDTVLYCDTLEYNENVNSYADPIREGYTFDSWDGTIPDVMPAQNVTLKAIYSINSYPVTFRDFNDTIIKTDTLEFDSKIVVPANPKREGYTFSGWNPADIPATVPADTLEFVAQYDINSYVVTFVDGVNKSVIEKPSFEYNASVVYPTVPEHEGYTFIKWADSLDVMPAENKTITATYQINVHSVTFMNDTVVKKITGNYGTAVTKPADLKREGYTFNGWDKEVPATIPDSDVVLNAQFTINDYYVFFLDWDNDTLMIDTVKYNSSDIDFPAQPKREGYRFTGYIDPAPSVMPAHNVTCKAQYVLDQFTVKFVDFNGNSIKNIKDNYGTAVIAPSNPKREGYTFTGWSDTVPATIPAKNVTLTAQYEINSYLLTFTFKETVLAKDSVEFGAEVVRPNYTPEVGYHFVSWSDNDTIKVMPAKDVTIAVKVDADLHSITTRDYDSTLIKQYTSKYGSELNIPNPSRDGYTFAGWSEAIPATMPAKDMVVYAQYTPNEYTITYKDDDQSIIKVDTFNYRDTIVKIADPEHTGYTFTGWSENIPATMPINGLEVVAQYQINNYIISFRTQEGSNIETKNHAYNSALVAPAIPDKVGYTILGWSREVPALVPAHNDTFYAQYSINQYIFSFEDKDGTIYKKDTLDYGAAIVAPADPTKEGYTFAGWDIEIPSVIPNMNITTLAQWNANPYELSFVDYNDTIIELDTLDFGAVVVYPTDPKREGYTFAGWADSIDVMPAHNDSLIAQYTINKYVVTIKDGDSIIYKDTLNYGDTIKAPTDLKKEGYEFAGWEPELPVTVPAKDIEVAPKWTKAEFVITFLDYNDTILAQDTLLYQANVVAPKPTREGYTFTGYDPAAPAKMPGKDLTCVAQYTINKHIIVFEDGDGNEIFRDTLVYGDPIIAPSDPTKDGYQFDGWNPVVPATVPDQDLTIVPQFSKSDFVITFLDFDSTEIFKDTLSFDAKIATIKDPKREGYTFAGWDPVVPTKMPGNDFTTVAQYTINKHVIVIIDGDDELFRDTLTFGDPINVDTVPTKEGFTFAGWDPIIPATVPDSDIVAYSTWIEDSLVLKSVDAFADNFCAGDVAQVYYTVTSGKPLSFSITFDEASKKAGFKTQTGKIGEDGEIFMEIPAGIEEGVYTATLQLIGVDSVSNSVKFNFSTNISSRYISRMWDDVVVVDNSDEEFDSYQWYKNGEKIEGATKQFYCELGGLDGFYSVIVKTKDGKEKHICGIQCDYVLPPFSIVAYPNPAKANVEFTLEVKGLTEEELANAKIYIYTVSGTIAHTEREIEYKNLVSLPQGEYIALVVVDGKSAFCKVLVR